jgi:hypothetical protein
MLGAGRDGELKARTLTPQLRSAARRLRSAGFSWLCGIGGRGAPGDLVAVLDQAATAAMTHGPAVLTPAVAHLYGDTAGLRCLFHTRLGSVTAYASHAVVLAWLTRAAVEDAKLATLLACRFLDHVLDRIAPFVGVRPVPAAHRLTVDHDGTPTLAPYWRVPAHDRPLAASAVTLRDQLTDAVRVRVRPVQRVTCDLSGGLDSTSLSFLAPRVATSLRTVAYPATAQANDDRTWARDAAAGMLGVAHVFIAARDYPLPYQDLHDLPARRCAPPAAPRTGRIRRCSPR